MQIAELREERSEVLQKLQEWRKKCETLQLEQECLINQRDSEHEHFEEMADLKLVSEDSLKIHREAEFELRKENLLLKRKLNDIENKLEALKAQK